MENLSKEEALSKLASRIKELRKIKGVSQQDSYNDTGIHFARIEQGKRDINYTTLIKISKYFNLSLSQLFEEF
ncbi:helix-turn-helix domain-containing protein [Seonamhaeicola marinus]|uniref:Helix-turn-helix transcriptional regulator n=1 Tax=Seonamhaeicola marinus TaxID=1912246 RepID=A0A5D0I7Z5_9FLAO|nr:helix-turn-helix transcriptional regulator [Seonamhaeicola marinus]TYA78537.1 helix-turn-helix transcriptional regulator [Seonamhaeicola marinus]